MNPNICKKCGLISCYVLKNNDCFCDSTKYDFYFNCKCQKHLGLILAYYDLKGLESYYIRDGKWKLFSRKHFWFKLFKKKIIDNNLKKLVVQKGCQYYIEQKLSEWNKK